MHLLPGPVAFDLDFEGEAKEGADNDDAGKHGEASERWLDCDGVDDVSSDEKLEPEQDRAAEAGAD